MKPIFQSTVICLAAAIALLSTTHYCHADTPQLTTPQLKMTLQNDNNYLPSSIQWAPKGVELLDPKMGLRLNFVSFEFRTKYYHLENKNEFATQADPRFDHDAAGALMTPIDRTDTYGAQVDFQTSYAKVRRTMLIARNEPRATIEYHLEFIRDVLVCESDFLSSEITLDPGFDTQSIYNPRTHELIVVPNAGSPNYATSVLNSGPRLFSNKTSKVSVLVSSSYAGDVTIPAPCTMLSFKQGQTLALTTELLAGDLDAPALLDKMKDLANAMPGATLPYRMRALGQLYAAEKKIPEAEAALLEAARLNQDYAGPFGDLAALRRDNKLPEQTEAWNEGGYRMPYNYGYVLSGMGIAQDKSLTEEQRRLSIFNLLITSENDVFYPDYYIWAARPFVDMKMYAQACAMYRQALWAVDYAPFAPAKKAGIKDDLTKKIADMEKLMLNQTNTALPPPIPVRAVK